MRFRLLRKSPTVDNNITKSARLGRARQETVDTAHHNLTLSTRTTKVAARPPAFLGLILPVLVGLLVSVLIGHGPGAGTV
jgi:hypothetical protein